MGTDILFQAERKVGEKWKVLTDATGSSDFFFFGDDRNKQVWDLLCGDIDPKTGLTFYGFVPIAPRRGAPPDYPPRKDYAQQGYSWVTLRELIDYPWEMRQRHVRAFVDSGNFRAYLDGATFRSFPVVPLHLDPPIRYPLPEWKIISQERMLELLVSGQPHANCYTEIQYMQPYDVSACFRIVTNTIPILRMLGDPYDIRIVFWFF